MIDGIKSFQRQNGLARDGIINPDGPTEMLLAQNLSTASPNPQSSGGRLIDSIPGNSMAESIPLGSGVFDTSPTRDASLNVLNDPETRTDQASTDALLGQATGDPLFSDNNSRFVFKPVPPGPNEVSDELFDAIRSSLRPTASQSDPTELFPVEQFDMLLRSPEELAKLVKVPSDLVNKAGPDGLQALLGVASSFAHDETQEQALNDLLTKLENSGQEDLAGRLRAQRRGMRIDPIAFQMLFPTETIRQMVDRTEKTSDPLMATGIGLGMAQFNIPAGVAALMALANAKNGRDLKAELERRKQFSKGQSKSRSDRN